MLSSFSQSDCDNCGTPLEGEYCHRCGQRKIDFKKDWNGIFHESLSSLFNFDGKFLRGIFGLTFYPGILTRRFLNGKRVSQIPPLRAYLFISLLFFFQLSIQRNMTNDDELILYDQTDEIEDAAFESDLERLVYEKLQNREAIIDSFLIWLPRGFLIGVLFLALALRVVLFRSGLLYIEQLVVALNLQSFIFLWILFVSGWENIIQFWHPSFAQLFSNIANIWVLVAPLFFLKSIFGMSWLKAVFVTGLVEMFYLIYLGFIFAGVGILSLVLS